MSRVIQGIVHGRTIELSEDPGIADGQQVHVVVSAVDTTQAWGEGIRRSAGAAADVLGAEEAFAQVERDRRAATRGSR